MMELIVKGLGERALKEFLPILLGDVPESCADVTQLKDDSV
jgi:hypothetical protein